MMIDDASEPRVGAAERACIDAIDAAAYILITSHPKPDGDAVGSVLALKRILAGPRRRARIAGLGPLPSCYRSFVADGEFEEPDDVLSHKPDILIAVDAGSIDRIPSDLQKMQGQLPIINIDHHAGNTLFGDINLVDTAASSAGEVIYRLARAGGYELDREAATALWIAIVTDTGRFVHTNTTPQTMRVAADLLAFGLPTEEIDRCIYRSLTAGQLDLHGRAIRSLQFRAGGRVACASLDRADFAAAGCGPEDTENIVEIPRSIPGVCVAVLCYETADDDGIKMSMRSNGSHDVAALCRDLGGGGHPRAAGCTVEGGMQRARESVLAEIVARWFGEEA